MKNLPLYLMIFSVASLGGFFFQPVLWSGGLERSRQGSSGMSGGALRVGTQLPIKPFAAVESGDSRHALEEFAANNRQLFGEIDTRLKRDALVMMVELLAESNPEEAARILGSAKAGDLGKQGPRLFVRAAEKWSGADPGAAHEWILAQRGRIGIDGYDSALAYIAANFVPHDPAKALEILGSITITDFHKLTKEEIAKRWVEHDPDAAFRWLSVISTDGTAAEDVNAYYLAMMRTFSKEDPTVAGELVTQLKSSRLRENLVPSVVLDLFHKGEGFDAAFEWVKGLPDQASRTLGVRTLVEDQGQRDLPRLVENLVAEADPSLETKRLLVSSLRVLAGSDREHAVRLLEKVPDDARFAAAESVTTGALVSNEAETMKWIETLEPGPVRDGAITAVAVNKMESDIGVALQWTRAVGDNVQRSQLVREMATHADSSSLTELVKALPEMNLRQEQRTLVEQIISERDRNP